MSYNRSISGNDSSDCDSLNRSSESSHDNDHKSEKSSAESDVGTFKLADETQMGGLNSLMIAVDIARNITNNNYKMTIEQSTTEDELKDDDKGMYASTFMYLNEIFLNFLPFVHVLRW